jgi:hypothetical protein
MCGKLKDELKSHPSVDPSETEQDRIHHSMCGEFQSTESNDISSDKPITGFHPNLSWSHYRVLMQVENLEARDFYETEAVVCGWNQRELERQFIRFISTGCWSVRIKKACCTKCDRKGVATLIRWR